MTSIAVSLSFASPKERQIQYPIRERGRVASDGFTDEHPAASRKGPLDTAKRSCGLRGINGDYTI